MSSAPLRIKLPASRTGLEMLIVAHRGNRARAPENSLSGFRQAIDEGADLLETDLRPTVDGRFICFHDPTLDRTTDQTGEAEGCTLAEAKRATLRSGRTLWQGETIPTLEELAGILPADVALALELKSNRFDDLALCESLVAELERLGLRERVIVLAFSAARLRTLRRAAKGMPCGHVRLLPWPGNEFELVGPPGFLLKMNPPFVRIAHKRGMIVTPLDTRPDRYIPFYRRIGVDALITDDPGATIAALRRS